MSIAKFKRKGDCLDYVDNAIEIQKEVLDLTAKLPIKWAIIKY